MARRSSLMARAMATLSPTAAFKSFKEKRQETTMPMNSSLPVISLQTLDTLTRLIDFLEEHHRREEGLYRKDGVALEVEELKKCCESHQLPDLAVYSPHSITSTIKEILGRTYEPLVPYPLSQELVDIVDGQNESRTMMCIIEKFKQVRAATRDFLKIFLIHLHHVSTSIPCRMASKDLASQVGILIIRCSQEPLKSNSSQKLLTKRKMIARLLIENACSLPYDCPTELLLPELPVKLMDPPQKSNPNLTPGDADKRKVHYVQALWDPDVISFTEDSLQELLSQFGAITNLAINETGNRALAAFVTAENAQSAAAADLPNVKIRERRQRTPSLKRSEQNGSPKHSEPHVASKDSISTDDALKPSSLAIEPTETNPIDNGEVVQAEASSKQPEREDYRATSLPAQSAKDLFLQKLERPPSILLMQKAIKEGELELEDFNSRPNSPRLSGPEASKSVDLGGTSQTNKLTVGANFRPSERHETHESIAESVGSTAIISPKFSKIGMIADLKTMFSKTRRNIQARKAELSSSASSKSTGEAAIVVNELREANGSQRSGSSPVMNLVKPIQTVSKSTQTASATSVIDAGTSMEPESCNTNNPSAASEAAQTKQLEERRIALEETLREVQTILKSSCEALAVPSIQKDVDRGLLQLHRRAHELVDRALNQTQPGLSFASSLDPTPLAEFVAFLETRASSQVKILEAEIRAGQELLRLHKSQHEIELRALESEITGLRLVRTQAEKMCAELRDDLRKCRNELGCHLATAAATKSDKRELEEQLVLCENQLRTKEQELFKLQLSHEELREAAASAQMRIEKYRQTGKIEMVESPAQSKASHASNQPLLPLFPKTTAFLSEHSSKNERNVEPTVPQSQNRRNMILYDNSRELQSMREKLQERIQAQIESTRAALQDIQVFDVSSPSLIDDETELTRMQQQLTSARAELEDAMDSSRDKLAQIMNPTISPHTHSHSFEVTEMPRALIQQLLSTTRFDNQELDNFENSSHSESCLDSDFMIPPGIHHMNLGAAARNQSQLYSAWQARRTQTKVTQMSGASQASKVSLVQAQQSMQAFNKTLATIRQQTLIPPTKTSNTKDSNVKCMH